VLARFREYPPPLQTVLGARYCATCRVGGQDFLLEGDEPFTAPVVAAALTRLGLRIAAVKAGDYPMDWQADLQDDQVPWQDGDAPVYEVWCPSGRPDQAHSLVIPGERWPLIGVGPDSHGRWRRRWWRRAPGWLTLHLRVTPEQAERWARVFQTTLPSPDEVHDLAAAPADADDVGPGLLKAAEYAPKDRAAMGARYWSICELRIGRRESPDDHVLIQADEPLTPEIVTARLRALDLEPLTVEWKSRTWNPDRWVATLAAPPPRGRLRYRVRRGKDDRADTIRWLTLSLGQAHLYFSRRTGRWERWSGRIPGAGYAPHHLDDVNDDDSELLLVGREQAERFARALDLDLPDEDTLVALGGEYRPGEPDPASPPTRLRRGRELGPRFREAIGARYCTTVRLSPRPSWEAWTGWADWAAFAVLLFGDEPFTPPAVARALEELGVPVTAVRPGDWPPGEWMVDTAVTPRCWDDPVTAVCDGTRYDEIRYLERRLADPPVHVGGDFDDGRWRPLLWTADLPRSWWAHGEDPRFPHLANGESRFLVTREQAERLARALGTTVPSDDGHLGRAAAQALDSLRCAEYSPFLRRVYGARYWAKCRLTSRTEPELQAIVLGERPLDAAAVLEQLDRMGVAAEDLTWHRQRLIDEDDDEDGEVTLVAEWRGRLVSAPPPDAFRYHASGLRPSGHVREITISRGDISIWYADSLARWDRSTRDDPSPGPLVTRQTAERMARLWDGHLPSEGTLTELTSPYSP